MFSWSDTITLAVSVTAIGAAIATIVATIYNYKLWRASIEPEVIVYAERDESRPTVIVLVIENIGHGLARDIRFECSRPVPAKARGVTSDVAPVAPNMTTGPLIEGIPALGPGGKRVMFWGQYGGLTKALGTEVIRVVCKCRDARGKEVEPVECVLEVRSFEDTDNVDPDGARQAARHLERISDELRSVTSGMRTLKVEVIPSERDDSE